MSILSASIYGTTFWNSDYGTGSVFSVSTTGSNYNVLHSFNCRDGFRPWCDLALSGNTLYGTTYGASPYSSNCTQYGNVFKVNTDGNGFAVLKDFNGSDGGYPRAGLVLSADTLYGTTAKGGSFNRGTVFKINTNGSGFTVIKNFAGSDGANPASRLVLKNALLFGTTSLGGISNCGTLVQFNTDGSGFTTLKSFTANDGCGPNGLLLVDRTLYGTAAGVFALALPPPPLNVQRTGNSAVLQWSDPTFTLRAAATPNGNFTNIPGATSHYTTFFTAPQQYFRLKGD